MMKRHCVGWVTGAILLGSGLGLLYGCASDDARSTNLLRVGDGGIDINEKCFKDTWTPEQRPLAGPCGLVDMWAYGGTNPDENCSKSNASTGKACTRDCITHCGFNALGTKICTCRDGFYTGCPCFKPPDWGGAPTAGFCNTPDGTTQALKQNPACKVEWEECIGTDPVSSTSPQACVCLKDERGALAWVCGSTNSWFEFHQSQ